MVLLALLAVLATPSASLAQAGSAGVFLRDVATGEWIIGLIGDRAVYDDCLWRCDKEAGGGYRLTSANRQVGVSLGRGRVAVGGQSHAVTEFSGPFVPPYPSPSADTMALAPLQRTDTATFVLVSRSRRQYYDYLELVDDSMPGSVLLHPHADSLGRVVVRHATRRPACLRLLSRADTVNRPIASVMAYCSPGDTALLYVDDIDGRAYFMGSQSRVNNELMAAGATSVYRLTFPMQTDGLDSALAAFGRSWAKSRLSIDSICAVRPGISAATRRCLEAYGRFCYAFECTYKAWSELTADRSGELSAGLAATNGVPALCRRVVAGFAADYEASAFPPSWAATSFRKVYAPLRFVLENNLTQATQCPASGAGQVVVDSLKAKGRLLFEKLLRPYRGKVVYLDLWGGWCAPCLAEMKHAQALRDKLRSEGVVFMYLANNTNGELYRELVSRFGLDAPGSVSFNLPPDQQAAIESYLSVDAFPTYLIIDREGNVVGGVVPRPGQAAELAKALREAGAR